MTNNRWVDARNGNKLHRDLVQRLTTDLPYAHAWLCHSDGSACEDGCCRAADPIRLATYNSIPEETR